MEINQGIRDLIEKAAILGLATVDKSGKPHNIAIGHVAIPSKNQIVIGDNYLEETLENIKHNPNVSLVVWHPNFRRACMGYELKGKAKYFTSGKWLELIAKIPAHKDEPRKGAILVTIDKIKVLHEKWQ